RFGGPDPVQVGAGDLLGRHLPLTDRGAQAGRAGGDQLVHQASSPRSCGTRNRSCSAAGAPASAASAPMDGRTSSGRNTLVSGSAWEAGATSSVATSLTCATESRITSSWGARWARSSSVSSILASRASAATSSTVRATTFVLHRVGDHPDRRCDHAILRGSDPDPPPALCRFTGRAPPFTDEAEGTNRTGGPKNLANLVAHLQSDPGLVPP